MKIFDSDTKDPTNTGQVLCTLPRTRRGDGSSTENGKKKKLSKPTSRTQLQRRTDGGNLPFLPPNPRPSRPTHNAMRDRPWHKVARVTVKATTIPVGGARRRREATLADSPQPSQLTIHPHAVSSTFDAHQDAVVEDPVPRMDAHRSQARMQSALLHLIPVARIPLAASFWGSSSSCWVSASSLSESFSGRPGGGNPGGKAMKSASFARDGTHVVGSLTRNCFFSLQAHGALHGADPASCNVLVRGPPDALFQWCPLPRDCHIGDLNGLVGVLLGHVQRDSGNARLCPVLDKFLTPAIFCASAPLAASLSANSLPACTLARLLTFMTKIAAAWYSTATQYWCHRSLHGPTGFALPFSAVDTKYSFSETRNKGVSRGTQRSAYNLA